MQRRFLFKKSVMFGLSTFSAVIIGKRVLAGQSSPHSFSSETSERLWLAQKPTLKFPPVPEEDPENGRNSNAHLPGNPELTATEKQAFIKEITQYALPLEKEYQVPACVIVAIAVFLSSFGRTREAYYANNLFRLKYINRKKDCRDGSCENIKTYQLVGQPNELANTSITIVKKYGDDDRAVFDESRRSGNRYRVFDSYQQSVDFLVKEVWLKNENYKAAIDRYNNNLKTLGANKAGQQFALEIATAGFIFMQPQVFQEGVAKAMQDWKLCPS